MRLFTIILIIILVHFSCKQKCPTPVCLPPDINWNAGLGLRFCNTPNDLSCYTNDELEEVIFTQRNIATNDVVRIDTINNLIETNYTIQIGAGSELFKFNSESTDPQSLAYYYEVVVSSIGKSYNISQLKLTHHQDPCECLEYNFKSVEVNDEVVELNENLVILKK